MSKKIKPWCTKKDRKEYWNESGIYILGGDEIRIEIGTASWSEAEFVNEDGRNIKFFDSSGKFWSSTEEYTLVVTKEINLDDEETDEGTVD